MQNILLVTPVWNDSQRLEVFGMELANALNGSGLSVHWVIADDGSSSREQSALKKLLIRFKKRYADVELIRVETRSRKGGAIYAAWDRYLEADWLAFVDADGAIGASTVVSFLKSSIDAGGACVAIRCREGAIQVERSPMRWLSFKCFNALVRMICKCSFHDTQCGLKVVPSRGYRLVRGRLSERGYVFDVELLVALSACGVTIRECPIPWVEKPGSKIKILRDGPTMLAGLLRIRSRSRGGAFLN